MTGKISAIVREMIDRVYPLGVILDFATEVDPNTAIGCGTRWERIADGRTLIASDAEHAVGWTGGEATHTLTDSEIAEHAHSPSDAGNSWVPSTGNVSRYRVKTAAANEDHAYCPGTADMNGWVWSKGGKAGGGQPHNNMQPSLAVCRWRRIA